MPRQLARLSLLRRPVAPTDRHCTVVQSPAFCYACLPWRTSPEARATREDSGEADGRVWGSDPCGGLKPANRRILYAMLTDLKLRPDGRYLESARVVHDVIDRYRPHAPTLTPELPGARHGDAWHTPLREAVPARFIWEDHSPVELTWRVGEQALLEARPPLAVAEADGELRLQDYDPGRYPMQVIITDLLGREARIDGELVVDRAAPQVTVAPTQTVDGLDLPAEGAAPVDLGPEGGLIRRWQTHWADGAGPTAEVAFEALDNPGGTPAAQLAVRWGWCWSDADGVCVNGELEANAPMLGDRLAFTADPGPEDPEAPEGWLGFNPLEGPAPHEYVALTATVADLAGNTSALPTRPVYRIEVVPPPPVVELWQTPPDDVDMQASAPDVVVFEVGASHVTRRWDRGAFAVGFVEWAGLSHYEAVFEPADIEIRNPLLTQ